MKGKTHLLLGILMLVIIIFAFNSVVLPLGALFFSIVLFIIGSILPDSDSNNKGSLIFVFTQDAMNRASRREFHKKKNLDGVEILIAVMDFILIVFGIILWPIALITNQSEKLIMKYTGRPRGHRESLHTIFGILVTSIFWSLIAFILYLSVSTARFNLGILLLFGISLFISQLFHLIEDKIKDPSWKISWK